MMMCVYIELFFLNIWNKRMQKRELALGLPGAGDELLHNIHPDECQCSVEKNCSFQIQVLFTLTFSFPLRFEKNCSFWSQTNDNNRLNPLESLSLEMTDLCKDICALATAMQTRHNTVGVDPLKTMEHGRTFTVPFWSCFVVHFSPICNQTHLFTIFVIHFHIAILHTEGVP